MFGILARNPITCLQSIEIVLNQFAQEKLQCAEPLWVFLSEYFSTEQLINIFVPLVGAFHHQLLVRLICSLAVINAINSLIKWGAPEYRPYWWVREYPELHNVSLRQHQLTCETSAGFPSSTTMAFTAFMYLFFVFSLTRLRSNTKSYLHSKYFEITSYLVLAFILICMWISRIYLATQFLHQCIIGSLSAIVLLHIFDLYSAYLYTINKKISLLLITSFALLPILIHFAMLRMDVDPHWCVRMAFKWCVDPSYLRHEASPIFVLGRDFGYLMGVGLSTPIFKIYDSKTPFRKRVIFLVIFEIMNYFLRVETPKQYGRFVFVAYEFFRNVLHSYTLLTILPKII